VTIVVVGAGIVGWAIAYELVSRGARVHVVDARGSGLGATRASAGILAPYIEGHIPELRALAVRSLGLYDRFIERVTADSGSSVEYERGGTLQVAFDAGEHQLLCSTAAALRDAGVAHAVLDASGTHALEPQVAANIIGALHILDHGYVAPGALVHALATAATQRGALLTTARVTSIAGGETPSVVTATERIEGDAVVVAAGSWSGFLAGGGAETPAVKPIRGQLLQLRLTARAASRVIWGAGCYLVPWRDGTVLAGATVEDVGFEETATVAGVQHLLRESAMLLPILQHAAFEDVRTGLRPLTADELPAIGPSSTMRQVFYATGHYRNGVLLAPLTAALLADLLLDARRSPELALVRPDRLGL
jgi:glycine oxidase